MNGLAYFVGVPVAKGENNVFLTSTPEVAKLFLKVPSVPFQREKKKKKSFRKVFVVAVGNNLKRQQH
jgi:hypothetical protein